jgi:flagellar protein FliO/FliZ
VDLEYVRFLLALLFVLGLIGLLAFLLRRFGIGAVRISPAFRAKGRNAERRLAVVEVAAVDARRRLVLVRRDDTEHLILLGNTSDLLIESNIKAGQQGPTRHGGSFESALRTAAEPRQ